MIACKCDANTWTTGHAPICDKYIPGDAGFCQLCWHDEGCHYADNEAAIRADERRKVLAKVKEAFGL